MLELKAEAREITGRKTNSLRRAGIIPAVLYGHGKKNQNLTVDEKEFGVILKEAGETSLVALKIGDKKHNVLIHDLSRHPLTDKSIHIDFYEVKMDEKIKTKVPLVFIGESMAVKSEGGILVRSLQEVEVEALPQDLPREINVDISTLNTFEDKIHVSDLAVGANVKILANSEEMVASVTPPRSEEELKELEAKPEEKIEEVQVAGKPAEEAVASEMPEAASKAE
ncbi:MAG: 50S ribosomal protein L25 [Parcubacteria group bacterium GW2011_GWF2_44_7]|nr:MAG: 50S ribosomal protein L25 [Parcubacteria group bacterium GW2011_GWF2_44_7]